MRKLVLSAAAILCLMASCAGGGSQAVQEDKQLLQVGDDIAIVNTTYGKIQGYIYKDVYTFLGIQYGAPTSGKNRFMPPQEPEKWEGVKPAVWYGDSAPQNTKGKYKNTFSTMVDHWNYYDVSEDCLSLNVWTPNTDSQKRPVLVWFHGGGFTSGNGIEQDGYDGNNIAREGNIVYVSVNHRLGPMGFTDLSAYGDEYKTSGNVGVLDLVAALKWVNKNIDKFGGDPSNVTIMGQSGGGSKVCAVLNIEEAKGLVHKAVALSGNSTSAMNQDLSRKVGEYILKEAGIKPGEISKLQEMPWEEYYALANRASQQAAKDNGGQRMGFSPVADDIVLPKNGYFQMSGYSKDVPVIFCTTFAESSIARDNAALEAMDKAEALKMWASRYGDKAEAVFDAYAEAFPELNPCDIVCMGNSPRTNVIRSADAKYAQGAPVYLAWFGYKANLFNGRIRAFHCSDISYWFKNTDVMYTHTGGGPEPRALSKKMSESLLSFMRTGDPNNSEIPAWNAYTPEEHATMIFNKTTELRNDPDGEALRIIAQ